MVLKQLLSSDVTVSLVYENLPWDVFELITMDEVEAVLHYKSRFCLKIATFNVSASKEKLLEEMLRYVLQEMYLDGCELSTAQVKAILKTEQQVKKEQFSDGYKTCA